MQGSNTKIVHVWLRSHNLTVLGVVRRVLLLVVFAVICVVYEGGESLGYDLEEDDYY